MSKIAVFKQINGLKPIYTHIGFIDRTIETYSAVVDTKQGNHLIMELKESADLFQDGKRWPVEKAWFFQDQDEVRIPAVYVANTVLLQRGLPGLYDDHGLTRCPPSL